MDLKNNNFYLYAQGMFSNALVKILVNSYELKPKAIIDRAPKDSEYLGIPVITLQDESIVKDLPLICTILGYDDLDSSLKEFGFNHIYSAYKAFEMFPESLKELCLDGFLWRTQLLEETDYQRETNTLAELFEEPNSYRTFQQLLRFRASPSAENYPVPENYEMYFPEDIPNLYPKDQIKVLDCGAFTGDTFDGFYRRYKDKIKSYVAVDISDLNLNSFKKRVQNLGIKSDFVCYHKIALGVSAQNKFSIVENGSATFLSSENLNGPSDIKTTTIDKLLNGESINILKMDIEGPDFEALQGAVKTITQFHPHLALSLYHNFEDLWRIPLWLEELVPNRYNFYLRQEGHWGLETNFYAVPKKAGEN